MRNKDTIMLEAAYTQIAHKRIISEEDTSNQNDAAKKILDKEAEVTELYKKASEPTATTQDLEAANKAFGELVSMKKSSAPAAAPQAPVSAPDVKSAEEKAKSMMDASGNSPAVSVASQPVAPAPQPAAAPVQPQQVAPKTPAAFVTPNANELAKFRKETGTNFNPSSRNDKLSMSLLRKGKSTLNTQQANAYRKANPNWTPETV